MILSIQQRYITGILRELGCVRREQLHTLLQGKFQPQGMNISEKRMEAMLRQLRAGSADLRMDDLYVRRSGIEPDSRMLEAIDVMLELSEGRPEDFQAARSPPWLLRFMLGGDVPRLFSVAHLGRYTSMDLPRAKGERIVWTSDSGAFPDGLTLPPKHFFAVRQSDGTHKFYGSNEP